ncbi:MAG: phosphoribosyl-ATP diphosphatase [Pseudomonadota bacterium]
MSEILNDLYQVLLTRKGVDADESYVASLYHGGIEKMGAKILEEAEEFIAEARTGGLAGDLADGSAGDLERLKEEGADLLFHVLVLMADQGLDPAEVLKTLEGRFGTSGHTEKASRCS